MSGSVDESDNLDQRRLELEIAIEKLQKAIRHWRTCEAEYEGFKEEIQGLKSDATADEIRAVADDFGGDILTSKECRDILESSSGTPRDVTQISSILNRRLDYVQDNVKTIQKQLFAAESRLVALDSIIEIQPRDEDGLPLQEITELLDDDDNVISGDVVDTNAVAPEILDHLRRSGIKGLPDTGDAREAKDSDVSARAEVLSSDLGPSTMLASARSEAAPERPLDKPLASEQTTKAFLQHAEQPQIVEPPEDIPMEDAVASKPTTVHEDVVRSLNEEFPGNATIPSNESPEQMALRREMLEYNMNEVGSVVATMDLDQNSGNPADGDSQSDDDEFDDESYDDDDSDDLEDEYGRSTVRVIDDRYRQEMLELEARLNARAMVNVGRTVPKHPNVDQDDVMPPENETTPALQKTSQTKKKGVRFADSLDIAESPPAAVKDTSAPGSGSAERPIVDTIVERSVPAPSNFAPATTKKHVSEFGTIRSSASSETTNNLKTRAIGSGPLSGMDASMLAPVAGKKPRNPSGTSESEKTIPKPILADTLIERTVGEGGEIPVMAPDEYDPHIMQQQIATEYHRMRNRLIQRNGGVVNRNNPDEDEAREGEGGKKISRFKAAKISQIRK